MDIITHTLSGMAAGTVAASFSDKNTKYRLGIVGLSGFAGALPDIDAISLWSRFDGTLGRFFSLSHSGKDIYSAQLWYSHHGFFHSVAAAFLFAIVVGTLGYWAANRFREFRLSKLTATFKRQKLLWMGFMSGYVIHLLQDMPTPASTWNGVNLMWPSSAYVGGTGQIWWWNNYDLFLIAALVLAINLLVLVVGKLVRFEVWKFTSLLFVAGIALTLIQIHTRPCSFAYSGHTGRYAEFEARSKHLQKQMLGSSVFNAMEWFDGKVRVHF